MKDIKLLTVENDNIKLSIFDQPGGLSETTDGSERLIQKVIYLLKQEENSNVFNPDGAAISSLLFSKIDPEESKIKVHLLISKLEQLIKAEQEPLTESEDPFALLEKITVSNVDVGKDRIEVGLIVFDKAGGKSYVRV